MSVYEFGPFEVHADSLLLVAGGEAVGVGPKVVATLLALIERPGEVVSKADLLDRVWPDAFVDEANLVQNVYVLRKIMRSHGTREVIQTIPRRGYRFLGTVKRHEASPERTMAQLPPAPRRHVRTWRFAAALGLALTVSACAGFAVLAARPVAHPTLSPSAAKLYAVGRFYWNTRTADGLAKSLRYFARVVDSDPRNARGYAALAAANAIMGDYGYGSSPPKVYYARARAYVAKALALDPGNGEAYAVLGMLASKTQMCSTRAQMQVATNNLERAVRLDPDAASAHEWYGIALLETGRAHEAEAELRKSMDLDPLNVATISWLANTFYLEHRYDDAISYARQALELSPQRAEEYRTLGLAYEARGEQHRAAEAFRAQSTVCRDCHGETAALLAELYARANRGGEALTQLAYARAHPSSVEAGDLALAFEATGQRKVASAWLRRICWDHANPEITMDPRFDHLRDVLPNASG